MKNKYLLLSSLLALVACKTVSTVEPVEALLTEMTESTQLQIVKAISTSMNGKSVKISVSSFTSDNRLTVMTNTEAMHNGNPINGRITDMPQHYQLMLRGNACYLVHEETSTEYSLENVNCKEK